MIDSQPTLIPNPKVHTKSGGNKGEPLISIPTKTGHQHLCHACGMIVPAESTVVCLSDVVFCEDCWPTLHSEEIARAKMEVALQGVPLS
ncbi:MAG TPA: hypothetical protein VFE42_23920 [Chloroflexota bacterium]|nr:hypothetical protein [Chloroflexota bacterium]